MLTLGDVSSASIGAALVIAITTEVGIAMVLFAPKMIEKFRAQGVEQGVKQEREKWQAWYRRSQEARANGQTFNEPPPASDGDHESP